MDYKEMTIEQKAKAYDEAIEKFDVILNLNTVKESGTIFADDVRKILPELKESEDERIRKTLIDMLKNDEKCYLKEIAWLEKQGEQKPYGLREECKDCQCNYVGECKGSCAMKRNEQKPWGKEDENLFKLSLENLTELKDRFGNEYGKVGDCIVWHKSLRPQSTWKPSDEQITVINDTIRFIEDKSDSLRSDYLYNKMKELLEQLKAL